jgi:hypothetical protein
MSVHIDKTYVQGLDLASPYDIGSNAREIAANNHIIFNGNALRP